MSSEPLCPGAPGLVRGYDYNSFSAQDCTAASTGFTGCAELDRLLGSRLAVANLELRVPLIGNDRYGLINFGFLPTELATIVTAAVNRPTQNLCMESSLL